MTLGTLAGLDLNVYPVGADRAFDQRSPTHSISWGYRRAAYGSFTDAGAGAGLATWAKAGIPSNCYLFARPAHVDDPHRQADHFLATIRALGRTHSAVIDRETDAGRNFDNGTISAADTQTIIDALDAAGVLVVMYSNQSQFARFKRVAAYIVANYSVRPTVPHDAWQFTSDRRIPGDPTSAPEDYDVWTNLATFRDIYPGQGDVVVPIPLPPTPQKERFPMMDLVPQTLQRVVDLKPGVMFHEFPSPNAARQGIVDHPDAKPANGQTPQTMAFGYMGKPIGVSGWIGIANGDRGVWVRETDVEAMRTQAKNVGA